MSYSSLANELFFLNIFVSNRMTSQKLANSIQLGHLVANLDDSLMKWVIMTFAG